MSDWYMTKGKGGKMEGVGYNFNTGCILCPKCSMYVPIGIDSKEAEVTCRNHEKECNGLIEVDIWRNGV
jgi:hypothetical protein